MTITVADIYSNMMYPSIVEWSIMTSNSSSSHMQASHLGMIWLRTTRRNVSRIIPKNHSLTGTQLNGKVIKRKGVLGIIELWSLSSCLKHWKTEILFWRFSWLFNEKKTNEICYHRSPFSFTRSVHALFQFCLSCKTKFFWINLFHKIC